MDQEFLKLTTAFQQGELQPGRCRFSSGAVTPPAPEDIFDLSQQSLVEREHLTLLGEQAQRRGEVGAIILAGGMATRFQYEQPKGLFPIVEDKTFLELKIQNLKSYGIPIFLMTSFHTHQLTLDYLKSHDYFGYQDSISLFKQYSFPRLRPDGTVWAESQAACGHGDFVMAMQQSGLLGQFLERGGKYLLFSNIDNLGATFEPVLLGNHISEAADMTAEVADKIPGDKGGAPARVHGRPQLVEEFLFPTDFDQNQIQVFNTATYIFNAVALTKTFALPWYVVEKKVQDQPVIQFEHLAGDLSRELDCSFIRVERDERFLPVKKLDDIGAVQTLIRRKFGLT